MSRPLPRLLLSLALACYVGLAIALHDARADFGPAQGEGRPTSDGTQPVAGPSSSTNDAIARYDGTTGKLLQNSGATVDDSGNLVATGIAFGGSSGGTPTPSVGQFRLYDNNSTWTAFADPGANHITVSSDWQWRWWSGTSLSGGAADTGLERASAGVVGVTDGSTGAGRLQTHDGTAASPAITGQDSDSGFVFGANTTTIAASAQGVAEFATNTFKHSHSTTGIPSASYVHATETVTLSGASTASTNMIPAGARLLGVTYRVTTAVTSGDGGTSFSVGDGSDVDRFGASIAFTLGTTGDETDYTADPEWWSTAARAITFTCNGGTFSGGVVRVHVYYLVFTAPAS